jgi:hypothetical protein
LDQGAAAEIDLGDGFRGGRRPWENAMVPWRIKNIQNPMTLVTLEHLKVLVEKKMVATLYWSWLMGYFEHFPTRLLGW